VSHAAGEAEGVGGVQCDVSADGGFVVVCVFLLGADGDAVRHCHLKL
jgi:hypothetical protein